jgi:UDP-2,3-diacylglucosamine hydrolase
MASRSERTPDGGAAAAERRLACVEIPAGALVIADLHLALDAAPEIDTFVRWLAAQRTARALFVLGDLFEYWIGAPHLAHPNARRVCAAFAAFAGERGPVHLLHGNRDFLLDAAFERASGARVHPFGLLGAAGPQRRRVLLLHGDELCIHDHSYQRMRRVLRSAPVAWLARALPAFALEAAARRLRRTSQGAVAAKRPLAVEQVPAVAWRWLAACDAAELVCGHAHRFREEQAPDGRRWRVLDAYGGARSVLRFDDAGHAHASAP